jgi:hypothetical protein
MVWSIVYGSGEIMASVLNLIGEEPERAASTFLLLTSPHLSFPRNPFVPNYDDPAIEEQWCQERRAQVE